MPPLSFPSVNLCSYYVPVIIGATTDGKKVLLACESGQRESREAWLLIIRDLIALGLRLPKLTVADGHLGIWAALGELHPTGAEQRCWNHKICNVLDRLPRKEQPAAKQLLRMQKPAPIVKGSATVSSRGTVRVIPRRRKLY